MSIYREWRLFKDWRRFYLDIEIQFSAGRNPEPDEYAADDTLPHVGPTVWEIRSQQDLHDALQQAWTLSHPVAPPPIAVHVEPRPFQDPDALTGNITTPAGAQDFQVAYDEKGGEAGWAVEPRNWVDQERDGS